MRNLIVCLAAAAAACATTQPSGENGAAEEARDRTPSGFPTKQLLTKIENLPIETGEKVEPQKEVETWKLEGPMMPDASSLGHPVGKPWEQLLTERTAAKRPSAIADESMYCIAREAGLFYLKEKAYPSATLETFIVGSCGAPNASTRLSAVSITIPKGATEATLFKSAQAQLAKLIDEAPATPTSFGLWFGEGKDKTGVFMLAIGDRKVHLKEVKADKTSASLKGQILLPAKSFRAVISKGAGGYGDCEVAKTTLPAFDFTCRAENGESAWVEMAVVQQGRELAEPIAGLVIAPGDTYKRANYFEGKKATSAADLTTLLHEAINRARAKAGLAPVELDQKESAAATALAAPYFAALAGSLSATVADAIALGVRAGWDVDGQVNEGVFMSLGPTTLDGADGMLAVGFERPSGRQVLFDPAVKKVAIGAFWSPADGRAGALIGAYTMFDPVPEEQVQAKFLEALNAARAKAGKKPASVERHLTRVVDRGVSMLKEGKVTREQTLDTMVQQAQNELKLIIAAHLIPIRSFDSIQFPEEALSEETLKIGLGGFLDRGKDEPWSRFLVWMAIEKGSAE